MDREVHDDEIVLSDDAMDRRRGVVEVVVERGEGLSQPVAALRPCGVLDEILGDQTERGAVSELGGPVKGQHRLCRRHRVTPRIRG